jgi:hypothetical protein
MTTKLNEKARLGFMDWVLFQLTGVGPDTSRLGYLRTLVAMYGTMAYIAGAVVMYSAIEKNYSTALLWAGASTLSMGGIGFLFGIPKTSQPDEEAKPKKRLEYFVNTNLQEISDWLTKIIIGVSLIQFENLVNQFRISAMTLSSAISGSKPAGPDVAVAYSIMVYFGVLGLVFGYLFTRLFLAEALKLADMVSVEELNKHVQKLEAEVQKLTQTERPSPTEPPAPATGEKQP